MKITELGIKGIYQIEANKFTDERGWFWKNYQKDLYDSNNINLNIVESFVSKSVHMVIRGMHFQRPPYEQKKLITCLSGEIVDVLIDIRKDSISYGKVISVILSEKNNKSIYVPEGIAHGFCVISKSDAFVAYEVDKPYHEESEDGIYWASIPFNWPDKNPKIVSARDQKLKNWKDFKSPF